MSRFKQPTASPKPNTSRSARRRKNSSSTVKKTKATKITKKTKVQKKRAKVNEVERCSSSPDRENSPCKPGQMYVGAHVSISGGLWKSVEEAAELGAKSFAMFLKGQRQWVSKPLKMEDAEKFKKEHGFSPWHIVPHGSYLMNCGSPKEEVLRKSRDMLVDELKRCDSLGLALFNFHPGSTCGEITVAESIKKIADSINMALDKTKYVTAVIENMSCQGNTIGGKFEELQAIIEQVKDKSRIGVCLDTCHAFAAGYDISTQSGFDQMMTDFEKTVGLKYLKALHLNDSKGDVGCHLDRHENIGEGRIGIEGFRRIMNDTRFSGLPMVLETPYGDYLREIRKLNSLVKKDK